jgi:hypothetical protein
MPLSEASLSRHSPAPVPDSAWACNFADFDSCGLSRAEQGDGLQQQSQRTERSQEVIENKGDHFIANCKAKRYLKINELFL